MDWTFMMISKFLAVAIIKNIIECDTRKRDYAYLQDRTFETERRDSIPGSWSRYLQPITDIYYESYLMMLKQTPIYDRDNSPMYDNFKRTSARSKESYGLHRRQALHLQTYGWACKCENCRTNGVSMCKSREILYIGLAKDPDARCIDPYDGTPMDCVAAHGSFCAQALYAMQQAHSQNHDVEMRCVCRTNVMGWLPCKARPILGEELSPGEARETWHRDL